MFAIDERIRNQVGIVAGGDVSLDEAEDADELDPDDQPISLA
jgi:hypothetical protein